jgi:succinoglycan biosynthesis protein ExoL
LRGAFVLRIAYFVHDITDPAISRRVRMLQAGGADVRVLGFRRDDRLPDLEGEPAIDLGRTYDARLLQRTLKVIQRRTNLGVEISAIRDADILLARNLEMLAIAGAAQRRHAPNATLVYECLDLHRLLLSGSPVGRCLRLLERSLMRRARLLIVSSPAFISRHYAPKQGVGSTWNRPVVVVENKVLQLDVSHENMAEPLPGPPWRIGWFGMIRCQRSLDILCKLANRFPGLVDIVIRGRPARVAFRNFDEQIAQSPGVSFGGAYRADELSALYRDVHFNWAIDYFEEGANSALLLPNRIYEGGPHGAVPIALARTETGRWLKQRGIGVLVDSPGDELGCFLEHLTFGAHDQLRQAVRSLPQRTYVADRTDCESLVNALTLAVGGESAVDHVSDVDVHAAGSINTI